MDKNILVSISCITYNHSGYIRECLDNFLNQQTNFNFEIIIHDDASTDGTKEIIQEYAKKHPNHIFPIFQERNQYSRGIRGMFTRFIFPRCSGKYIALCEGDDYWTDPLKLQKQVDFLENNKSIVLCFHNALVIKDVENKKKERRKFYDNYSKTIYDGHDVLKTWLVPTASIVFRNIFKEYPDILKSPFEDIALQLYVCEFGKMYFMNEVMSVYRIHDGSITVKGSNDPSHYKELKQQYTKMDKYFNGKYSKEINDRLFHLNLSSANAYKNTSLSKQLLYFGKAVLLNPGIAIQKKGNVIESIKSIGVSLLTIFKIKND